MSIAEELGRPMIQRGWFERQFVRTPAGELHFHEGPFRPVRSADPADRDDYVARAMAHMATTFGWLELTAIPMALIVAFFFASGPVLVGLVIDIAVLWAVLRFAPDLRATRRRLRAVVEGWPVVAPVSPRGYFARLWSRESLARIGPRERRTLVASGLFFSLGGALLVAIGAPFGWLGVVFGLLGLLAAVLAYRAARLPGR